VSLVFGANDTDGPAQQLRRAKSAKMHYGQRLPLFNRQNPNAFRENRICLHLNGSCFKFNLITGTNVDKE